MRNAATDESATVNPRQPQHVPATSPRHVVSITRTVLHQPTCRRSLDGQVHRERQGVNAVTAGGRHHWHSHDVRHGHSRGRERRLRVACGSGPGQLYDRGQLQRRIWRPRELRYWLAHDQPQDSHRGHPECEQDLWRSGSLAAHHRESERVPGGGHHHGHIQPHRGQHCRTVLRRRRRQQGYDAMG